VKSKEMATNPLGKEREREIRDEQEAARQAVLTL
jgi:hypothetical protein